MGKHYLSSLETFQSRVTTLLTHINLFTAKAVRKGLGHWIDSQEVCLLLNISQRTLQYYRDQKKIPYSHIGKKYYYKIEDIYAFLNTKTQF